MSTIADALALDGVAPQRSAVTHYVCGFLFTPHLDCVVLIRKNRPAWQAGKLNGVGGKVEPGESPHQAMVREFREEAGLQIEKWSHFAKLSGEDFQVWFYAAAGGAALASTRTDEAVELHPAYGFYGLAENGRCVENLPWLVPMAREHMRSRGRLFSHIRYGGTDQAKEGGK